MKHVVIGTAGHVDHGKTALVRALTGVDSSMEYRAQDDAEWTAVDGDADTVEVAPGVYLVRAAGSGTVLASQSIPVAVAAYAAPGATGITLDQTSLRLYHNASPRTAILTASVLPEGAKQTVTWSSSDEGVATVEDGLVRAVAEGTAVITVTSADGGFTAQCSVRVRTRHASSKDSGSSGSGSGSGTDSSLPSSSSSENVSETCCCRFLRRRKSMHTFCVSRNSQVEKAASN